MTITITGAVWVLVLWLVSPTATDFHPSQGIDIRAFTSGKECEAAKAALERGFTARRLDRPDSPETFGYSCVDTEKGMYATEEKP